MDQSTQEAILNLIAEMDWDRVRSMYKGLKWTWDDDPDIPSTNALIAQSIELLESVSGPDKEDRLSSTGGITAVNVKGKLMLFIGFDAQ